MSKDQVYIIYKFNLKAVRTNARPINSFRQILVNEKLTPSEN